MEAIKGEVRYYNRTYLYLSPQLKQCIAYCSLFPKDYEFQQGEIILLWMVEGFLNHESDKKQMENLGRKYFQELYSRLFFQLSSSNKSLFVMHDLNNDLLNGLQGRFTSE